MSYRAYHISMSRGQCRLCPKTSPNTPQNYGKEEEEKKKDKVVHFSYICHPIYWLILSIVLYFVVIVARNLNKCVKTEILHWLNNWPFHPAFLGSEQRKSNGCAAMVGPCHELRPGWGPKANQQVTKALVACAWLLFSFSIRSYVLKEIVGPRQKSRASEKEVGHFATICCFRSEVTTDRMTEWPVYIICQPELFKFCNWLTFPPVDNGCLRLPDVSSKQKQ